MLHDVLYIVGFNFNLIYVSQLVIKYDCSIRFTDQIYEIQDNHTMRMIDFAKMHHKIYVLENPKGPGKHFSPNLILINYMSINKVDDWYFKIGQLSKGKLFVLSTKFDYISSKTCDDFCRICPLAKQKRLPFSLSTSSSNKIFYLLHMDVWGPLAITYVDGYRFFFTVVDDFLSILGFFLFKTISEVQGCIKFFITLVETKFSTIVKCIRSDQGLEFNLHQFYSLKGIKHKKVLC